MLYMKREDVKERNRIEYYFDCPGCGQEISDIDVGFSDTMECPHCGRDIYFERS